MNTIGKILVILNLLIAVAVGGFLVVDFATRTNWKAGYDALKRELEVARTNNQVMAKTMKDLNQEVQKSLADRDVERSKILENEATHKAELATEKLKFEDANLKTKEADLNLQRSQAEVDRLKEEVKGLLATLQKRERSIVDLEDAAKKYRTEAIANKNEANTMQDRNENLRDQIRRLTQAMAEMQNRGSGDSPIVRDPNQPNPPSTYVKGRIERIDPKDRTLIEISVGSDQGVNKNHTLEVYRTAPRAEYLGTVRIIDSFPHKSVGKLMRASLPRPALQEGDIVASSIGNQ